MRVTKNIINKSVLHIRKILSGSTDHRTDNNNIIIRRVRVAYRAHIPTADRSQNRAQQRTTVHFKN